MEVTLKADRTSIYEGESVNFVAEIYGIPDTTVKLCVYVEGSRGGCDNVPLDSNGYGKSKFVITFPSYGNYSIMACVVNPLTNEKIACSREVLIKVSKKPSAKPELTITAKVDKKEIFAGEKVMVYGTVKNEGSASSSSGYIYIYVDDKKVASIPLISLPPGESVNYSRYIVIYDVGDHIIKSCAYANGSEICSNAISISVKPPEETPGGWTYTTIEYMPWIAITLAVLLLILILRM